MTGVEKVDGRSRAGSWTMVWVAITLDVVGAVLLREADGYRQPGFLFVAFVLWMGAIVMLAFALRTLPISVAYPMFLGVTSVGVYACSLLVYGDAMPWGAMTGLALVIFGVSMVNAA